MIVAILFAKAESKRLPGKNMRLYCGKPLLEWSFIQASNSKNVDAIVFVTDDNDQADLARKYSAIVEWQPQEEIEYAEKNGTAGGAYASRRAIRRAIKEYQSIDCIVSLMATNPLRKPSDIDRAVDAWKEDKSALVWAGHKQMETVLYTLDEGRAQPEIFDKSGKYITSSGCICVGNPEIYLKGLFKSENEIWDSIELWKLYKDNKFGPRPIVIETELWQQYDIDTEEDWKLSEVLMERYILQGKGAELYEQYHMGRS